MLYKVQRRAQGFYSNFSWSIELLQQKYWTDQLPVYILGVLFLNTSIWQLLGTSRNQRLSDTCSKKHYNFHKKPATFFHGEESVVFATNLQDSYMLYEVGSRVWFTHNNYRCFYVWVMLTVRPLHQSSAIPVSWSREDQKHPKPWSAIWDSPGSSDTLNHDQTPSGHDDPK